MNIAGVSLGLEDLALLDQLTPPEPVNLYSNTGQPTASPLQMPMSAPAWQTTFNFSSGPSMPKNMPSYTHQPMQAQYAEQSYDYSPSYFSQAYSMGQENYCQTAPLLQENGIPDYFSLERPQASRRRGSSIDSHVVQALPSNGAYNNSVTQLSSPPIRKIKNKPAAVKKLGRRASTPAASAQFVNFTPADSSKLLNGVAPSGSSKRKREEAEAKEVSRKRVVSA